MIKRYDEIMDKVTVTDEMRQRILKNIQAADVNKKTPKVAHFPSYKKYLSFAACFAVLLVGVLLVPYMLNLGNTEQPPEVLKPGSEIVKANSAEELEEMVGFDVKVINELPFEVEEVTITSHWGKLAQIAYYGQDQNAVFRMAVGREDISGDYNDYSFVVRVTFNNHVVTLKGNTKEYQLAIWSDEEYSYSISLSRGISQEEWLTLIGKVM